MDPEILSRLPAWAQELLKIRAEVRAEQESPCKTGEERDK